MISLLRLWGQSFFLAEVARDTNAPALILPQKLVARMHCYQIPTVVLPMINFVTDFRIVKLLRRICSSFPEEAVWHSEIDLILEQREEIIPSYLLLKFAEQGTNCSYEGF